MVQTKNKNSIKAVIFDIDGTLSPDISWTKLTLQLGYSVPNHMEIYEKFKNGKLEYNEAKKALLSLWTASGPLSKSRLEEMFKSWALKDDAIPIFQYLKSKNYITCLITGSMDLFAQVITQRVGADFWYANTDLIWDSDNYLKDFIYEINASEKKLRQLQEFCKRNSLELNECATVGDDKNDIGLFRATKNGIVIKSPTSKALEPFSWRKIETLIDLKKLL